MVHHHQKSGLSRPLGSRLVDHAQLHPHALGADGDRLVDDGPDEVGAHEAVDDVDREGDLHEGREACFAVDRGSCGVDGNDALSLVLQELRHLVGGAGAVRGKADHGPGLESEQLADIGGHPLDGASRTAYGPRMRKIVLSVMILIAAVGHTPSDAATACRHQITDPTGDTDTSTAPSAGDDDTPRIDLVSADLATTPRTVTVVVEVKSLAFEGTNLGENQYWLRFGGARTTFTATAYVSATSVTAYLYRDGGSTSQGPLDLSLSNAIGQGTVLLETTKRRVRMTFDRALVDANGGLGSTVDVREASTWRGQSAAGVFATGRVDVSELGPANRRTYQTDKTSGCL